MITHEICIFHRECVLRILLIIHKMDENCKVMNVDCGVLHLVHWEDEL